MKLILGALIFLVLATVSIGVRMVVKDIKGNDVKTALIANMAFFIPLVGAAIALMVPDMAFAATESEVGGKGLAFIGAALSTGFATIGAGIATGAVGSAALGAVSEDDKILGKTLIFVGLAEGIAIYGLIVSILILGRI